MSRRAFKVKGKVIHRFILPDVFTLEVGDVIFITINRKRVRMVVDDQLTLAVNRVADCIEENTSVIKQILEHYNAVVPSMKEGADRANKFGRIAEAQEMRENGQHN